MTPCIEHAGYISKYGYGEKWRHNRSWQAHRLAWIEERGPIPDGMVVMHSCDNRACINLDHLILGTMGDNNRDRDAKRRQARGERVHLAKLTASDIPVIRTRATSEPHWQIAADYGVTREAVSQVVRRQTWKHIN